MPAIQQSTIKKRKNNDSIERMVKKQYYLNKNHKNAFRYLNNSCSLWHKKTMNYKTSKSNYNIVW